jgi:hypothetical protein
MALAAGQALAIPVPCCEGGSKPNKRCSVDENCPNVCFGGQRDGKNCVEAEECWGTCVGGNKPGAKCFRDSACSGGGTCTDVGTCDFGTCTATCEREKPKETPGDPAAELLQLPTPELSLELPEPAPRP